MPASLENAGGALRLRQDDFTPQRLANEIAVLAGTPQRLAAMAAAAKSVGRSTPPNGSPTSCCAWRGSHKVITIMLSMVMPSRRLGLSRPQLSYIDRLIDKFGADARHSAGIPRDRGVE